MERVHKLLFLILSIVIAFLSLVASSDGRTPNLGNQRAKIVDAEKVVFPTEPSRPTVNVKSPRMVIVDYTEDPYGLLTEMGRYGGQMSVDGVNRALYDGYPQGYYGASYGYGYPFPGGIFGFPRGRFGFPQGIFGFPGSIFGFPGGLGGFPGGYGINPGKYDGNPGGYGLGGPGGEPGGGNGGKAEVKGKNVNSP